MVSKANPVISSTAKLDSWVEPWLIPADNLKIPAGDWQELDAIRVAPLKGTAFSEWQFNNDMSLRVQAFAIGGTDKAKKDAVKYGSTVPAEIKGFATMDVDCQCQSRSRYCRLWCI